MYTIKQAASRSGVPVQLLRAWERRYGVVEPARAPSGYRLYDDAAIARLRAMRRLIDDGWAPSTAAGHIRQLEDSAVDEILITASLRSHPAARATDLALSSNALTDAFVEAAAALDEPAFERILDQMFAYGSFEQATSELVMPALVELGDGWEEGRVNVAAEHAAAGAVHRRLGMAFFAAGAPHETRGLVLVGMPVGARHNLGALAFATAVRRAGIGVSYLGADLPIQDWLEAVERTDARAAVIGAVIEQDTEPAGEVARAIRAANPEVLIAFGGRHAPSVATAGLDPVLVLPQDLSSSVEVLRRDLASRSRDAIAG